MSAKVGQNVQFTENPDSANSAVTMPSRPLKSVNCKPVESHASWSRVQQTESKKTVTVVNHDLPVTVKRPKVYDTRDLSLCRGASASHINEIGTAVGPNVKSKKHPDAENFAVVKSSKRLRSELRPVESLASRSRAHEIKSKKTADLMNFNVSSTIKRPKVYPTRYFPPRFDDLASDITEIRAEESTNHSYTANYVVAIPPQPIRSLDAEPVESLDSWSRGHEIETKENANHGNHKIYPEIKWKKKMEMALMFVPPAQSEDRALVQASEPNFEQSTNEEVSLSVRPHDLDQAAWNKVKATLKEFEKQCTELLNKHKSGSKGEGKGARRVDIEAAECMRRKGKCIYSKKQLGHIQGIAIGDRFQFRAELAVVGLHCQYVSGIDFMSLNGRMFATSIVNSGCYENRDKSLDVLIYSGQGGNPLFGSCKSDQELKRGNLALSNSMGAGYPVRVIRKSKSQRSSILLHRNGERGLTDTYEYYRLYTVKKYWQEREDRRLVFKFELYRIQGHPLLSYRMAKELRKFTVCNERCMVEDVSQGKEKNPVRAINGIDDEKPQPFTYITDITYPDWCNHSNKSGCNCTDGCSNSAQCLCVMKNGGEISFSERGIILGQKDIVYECGPSCKCPLSCMNRVSQHGPRYRLEIFRTQLQTWGVRSRSYISSGGFVCEYIGNLLQIKNARPRSEHEQVGFMHAGFQSRFMVDPAESGNVGRFISHSGSPNLNVRYILYDHDDKRIPHIMLFAAKNIPPMQELTCDYNHVRMRFSDSKNA